MAFTFKMLFQKTNAQFPLVIGGVAQAQVITQPYVYKLFAHHHISISDMKYVDVEDESV